MITRPVIYDLVNDAHAATWGLQPWERDYLLTRCFKGRGGASIEGIVFHIQAGTTRGSLRHFVSGKDRWGNPIAASCTVLIQKDGSIVRCIPEADGPWTNGDVEAPSAKSAFIRGFGGNPNNRVVTVELEGQPWDAIPEVQLNALLWWTRDVTDRRGWDVNDDRRYTAHRDYNSVSRPNCGLYRDDVMKRLRAEMRGDPVPSRPSNYGQYTAFAQPLRVRVEGQQAVNIRRWGDTDAAIMGELEPGAEFFASGWVYGDDVAGENRWYEMCGPGYRLWAGATDKNGLRS